jgi:hypothetical protein
MPRIILFSGLILSRTHGLIEWRPASTGTNPNELQQHQTPHGFLPLGRPGPMRSSASPRVRSAGVLRLASESRPCARRHEAGGPGRSRAALATRPGSRRAALRHWGAGMSVAIQTLMVRSATEARDSGTSLPRDPFRLANSMRGSACARVARDDRANAAGREEASGGSPRTKHPDSARLFRLLCSGPWCGMGIKMNEHTKT